MLDQCDTSVGPKIVVYELPENVDDRATVLPSKTRFPNAI